MKRLILSGLAFVFLFSTGYSAVPKLMNYQGLLNASGGGPATDSTYSVDFTIYDAPVGGNVLWSESRSVTTVDGLFSIILGAVNPVVDSVFNDSTRWLGIKVNPDLEIAPRNQIVTVGYSYRVSSVDGAMGGNIISKVSIGTNQVNSGLDAFVAGVNNTVSGDASVVGGGGGNTAGGVISTVSGGGGNSATGFAATVGGGQNDSATANYATIAGGLGNNAVNFATTISGGHDNFADSAYSTIGGGVANSAYGYAATVAGGHNDTAAALYSTIGGGFNNIASGGASVIAGGQSIRADGLLSAVVGGYLNVASGAESFVGGGFQDSAQGFRSTVGGGSGNVAGGQFSTVPGGRRNHARADYSFAAGRRARAEHIGAFVWADSADADFTSTADNQFLIRTERMGLGLNDPSVETKLHIRHFDGDNFGLLIDAHGVSGSELGLHSGPLQYASLAKNAFHNGGNWQRFNTADGAYLQEIEPDGDVNFNVAPAGANPISFTTPLFLQASDGRIGMGTNSPSIETKVHIRHFDVNNFGLLIDAHGNSGSEIGLHAGFLRYSSLVKNAYHSGGNWQRFNTTDGAYLQEIEPDGDVEFKVAAAGANPIAFTSAIHLSASNGYVGLGTSTPAYILQTRTATDQYSYSHTDGTIGLGTYINGGFSSGMIGTYTNHPFQIYTSNSGPVITFTTGGSSSGNVGIGSTSPSDKLEVHSISDTVASFNRNGSDGVIVSLKQAGTTEGTISVAGAVVSYNAFTGSHYGFTDENIEFGELVTLTGINENLHNNEKSEIIYGIRKSRTANDPSCLGAYLALSESSEPQGAENPHLVMAVGNGEMWVVDNGCDIQVGDYLISSSTLGHAMKDDESKYPIGHIVARAAENVEWSNVVEQIDGVNHKKISVLFGNFVRTSNTALLEKVVSQEERITELERKLEKLETSGLRSELR